MAGIDYSPYLRICKRALTRDYIYKSFRGSATYSGIVGGISYQDGLNCVSEIKKRFGMDQSLLNRFAEGDKIGCPNTYFYEDLGMHFDPSTLRYIRILIDLLDQFGDLRSFDIVEIGSGYGGQCKVIYDFTMPKSYTLIDLPSALELSKKYLSHFGIPVIYRTHNNSDHINYSLCISNYAFSEIDVDHQLFYKEQVLDFSERGYMICNGHITKEYMLDLKKGGLILPEVPPTSVDNFLYVWK